MLPVLSKPRPVDPEWRCHKSGDCCTKPATIVVTVEEKLILLVNGPPHITPRVQFRDDPDNPGFVYMKTGPCPFFVFNTCTVYANRPYNCRRFACMRPDPKSEPFELDGDGVCKNLMERVASSRAVRRLAQTIQRRAQKWADKHGWKVWA